MQRREFLKHSLAAASFVFIGVQTARPSAILAEELPTAVSYAETLEAITDGAELHDGSAMMQLNIPDAPPSGSTVPIEVSIDHPMEEGNYIAAIHVLSTKNKINHVISASLSPANGKAYLYVNAKLGGTQDVVVLAQTGEGKFYRAAKSVKVTLGGCG